MRTYTQTIHTHNLLRNVTTLFLLMWGTLMSQAQMFTNIRATQTMNVAAIAQSDDEMVWFGAGKTLYSFDGKELRVIESDVLNSMGAILCIETEHDKVIVGSERGLAVYDTDKKVFKKDDTFNGLNVRAILIDAENRWVGCDKGFYCNSELVCKDLDVLDIMEYKGKILVASMNGCWAIDAINKKQTALKGLENRFVSCLSEDGKGGVIVGSVNTMLRYDERTNVVEGLPHKFSIVKCLERDSKGNLLVGCDGGLYEVGKDIRHIKHDARDGRSLAGNTIGCMMKDKRGNLWIGTDNGLSVMPADSGFNIISLPSITNSGMGNLVHCLLYDAKNRLWLGGTNGIIKVDSLGSKGQQYVWYEMNSEEHPIPHNRIRSFYEDPIWGLWACTDGGLLHFDEEHGEWGVHILPEDAHNWVYNIWRDDDALSVNTFDGVYRLKYDMENKTIAEIKKSQARPKLDDKYKEARINDRVWRIGYNGVNLHSGDNRKEIDLPEKFISIYYNADQDLVYLGGADYIAVADPDLVNKEKNTSIWFDANARFVEDVEDHVKRNLIMGICGVCVALLLTLGMYVFQQRRMKTERARRVAILKSAREKVDALVKDNQNLQQKLHLQFLSVQAGKGENGENIVGAEKDDEVFIINVTRVIEENIDNPDFSVTQLSSALNISSKQLYRKVKLYTGMTAVEFIRKLRLQKAAILLKNTNSTINEVMYMVGFSNPSYFSRSFANEYGMPPSEYRANAIYSKE